MGYDPSTAPRQREAGYKGDGWTVTLPPPDGSDQVVALDTGLDSLAIVRIPNARWDRGASPGKVHAHQDHDETIVIPTGSGRLIHGPDVAHLRSTRFRGPVVLVLPATTWHHIVMDPEATATGTCFFTAPDTVLVPFADRQPLNAFGKVTFANLEVVSPRPVHAAAWTGDLTASDQAAHVDHGPSGESPVEPGAEPGAGARIIPYEQPADGYVLPLDTGHDSLFVMISRGASWDRAPEVVDVHSHSDVDEFIVIEDGTGFLLNGPELESVTLTPFQGPAVIVMPAGAFHRIVRTDDRVVDSILVYTDRRAVVPRYQRILERTTVAALASDAVEGASQ